MAQVACVWCRAAWQGQSVGLLPPCSRSYTCLATAVPGKDAAAFPLAEVQSMVEDLHANEQRYVLIVDPGIASGPGTEVSLVRLRLLRAAIFGGHVRCGCTHMHAAVEGVLMS
jgi:hypothetical protein